LADSAFVRRGCAARTLPTLLLPRLPKQHRAAAFSAARSCAPSCYGRRRRIIKISQRQRRRVYAGDAFGLRVRNVLTTLYALRDQRVTAHKTRTRTTVAA